MSDVKWIQIVTDIFDNWKIKQIKAMPEGHTMVCIWFELLCLAGKQNNNGFISFIGKVVTTDELLATILNEDIKVVQMSLSIFEKLKMITITNDCDIQISNWCEYQNVDGLEKIKEQGKLRQQRFREKQKQISTEKNSNVTRNVTVTLPVTLPSYSISNSNNLDKDNIVNNSKEYIKDSIRIIIDYLNLVTKSRYTYNNKHNNKLISGRLNDGFTVDDFKTVIDKKYAEWKDTEMEKYLVPGTLFAPSHFENYLNQNIVKSKDPNEQIKNRVSEVDNWV